MAISNRYLEHTRLGHNITGILSGVIDLLSLIAYVPTALSTLLSIHPGHTFQQRITHHPGILCRKVKILGVSEQEIDGDEEFYKPEDASVLKAIRGLEAIDE